MIFFFELWFVWNNVEGKKDTEKIDMIKVDRGVCLCVLVVRIAFCGVCRVSCWFDFFFYFNFVDLTVSQYGACDTPNGCDQHCYEFDYDDIKGRKWCWCGHRRAQHKPKGATIFTPSYMFIFRFWGVSWVGMVTLWVSGFCFELWLVVNSAFGEFFWFWYGVCVLFCASKPHAVCFGGLLILHAFHCQCCSNIVYVLYAWLSCVCLLVCGCYVYVVLCILCSVLWIRCCACENRQRFVVEFAIEFCLF